MSEAQPVTPVPAATVLLVRDKPDFEVLMVKRHHQIDFASGALVFPGGKAEAGDGDPAWADLSVGWRAEGGVEQTLKIAAIREAFEESGVLLAQTPDGAPWCAEPQTSTEGAAAAREAVARGERAFIDLVRDLDLRLHLDAMAVYARWITPETMPKRFDTWFFIATAPEDQLAACDGWETVDAEWIAPDEALRLAGTGERKIIFPTRMNLQMLAESGSGDEAIAAARARAVMVVEPKLERRGGEQYLVLPPDAGYGRVAELLSAAM
jgi:8-oxo-dGTP pyrophosphatase MutT (NUDIX family)